ncbi:hypothetical protein NIES21_60940 (plasmid) [Anabaenopsis circularis NIES-21]|uniref:Uncharacterized protein n=1 Tax=Anabaenopsis circularis NIES-21 TaxID=1085406 RepID=A0A1Z4GRU2_9CYAN|nr:hypothetical protein NIES21_60940 [Anabaenopsis circularis NIES-21]
MISNLSQQSSTVNTIGVQATDSTANFPILQQPSLLDYFALLPALITALTPLILGLSKDLAEKNKDKSNKDESDNK